MNDKDKEAFEKWIDNDVLSQDESTLFKNMSEQERVVFVTERTWQAACEYVREKISLDQARSNRVFVDMARKLCEAEKELKEWKEAARSEANIMDELQAENKKLRECVEYYADLDDECIGYDIRGITTAREVLEEVENK